MFFSTKKFKWSLLAVLATLLMSALLAACGDTNVNLTDNNFSFPVLAGLDPVPALAANPDFTRTLLEIDPKTIEPSLQSKFGEKSIQVFQTAKTLDEVKAYYTQELVNQGWANQTAAIAGPNSLGNDGWVLGFEKQAGNGDQRGRTLIMIGPNAPDNPLKQYRASGVLDPNKNVLIVIDVVFSPNGSPAAPTATPKP